MLMGGLRSQSTEKLTMSWVKNYSRASEIGSLLYSSALHLSLVYSQLYLSLSAML